MTATPSALAVVYGSHARGDADNLSDLDLLLLGNQISDVAAFVPPANATSSFYSWKEWEALRRDGSIFLHHLAAESEVLWGDENARSRYRASLSNIPQYRWAVRDLASFDRAVEDIELELTSKDVSTIFELATLAMIIRHVSILACYLTGRVNFSRVASVHLARERLRPASRLLDSFEQLYAFRLFEKGRLSEAPELPNHKEIEGWLAGARELITATRELL